MADFSKSPESKNFEDRRPKGLKAFIDAVNEKLGTGRYSREFQADQKWADIMLAITRMEPIRKMAAERHAENVRENPSIPADLDIDIIVENWIRRAQLETAPEPVVDLRKFK